MSARNQIIASLKAAAAGGGIAEVGSGSQRAQAFFDGVDTANLAFPANVGNARLLVVAGSVYNGGAVASVTVTDTRSTSYTTILETQIGLYCSFIAYGITSSGGANTVTVDPDGATTSGNFAIDEFSGVNATPLDVNGGSSTGFGETAVSDNITTVASNALIIGVMTHVGDNYTITPGGSYTTIGEYEDGTAHIPFSMVFRLVTTAQAYTVDWTLGTASDWSAQTASFKP